MKPIYKQNGACIPAAPFKESEEMMTTPPADGDLNIDTLERLARAATPGPWYCYKKDEEAGEFLMDFGGIFNADGTPNYESRNAMSGWISLRDRDAPYIAAANPETVLSLIGRIRELESALATPSPGKADEPVAWHIGNADGSMSNLGAIYRNRKAAVRHIESYEGELQACIVPLYASPGKADAERETLLKDKARLDSGVIMTSERDEFGEEYTCERRGLDLRAMIDAAMQAQERDKQ